MKIYVYWFVQGCNIIIANAQEILQCYTKPFMYSDDLYQFVLIWLPDHQEIWLHSLRLHYAAYSSATMVENGSHAEFMNNTPYVTI